MVRYGSGLGSGIAAGQAINAIVGKDSRPSASKLSPPALELKAKDVGASAGWLCLCPGLLAYQSLHLSWWRFADHRALRKSEVTTEATIVWICCFAGRFFVLRARAMARKASTLSYVMEMQC